MQCNKLFLFLLLVILFAVYILYLQYTYKKDTFLGEVSTDPSTSTLPQTTISYSQLVDNTNKLYDKMSRIGDKVNLINKVADMESKPVYDENEILKDFYNKIIEKNNSLNSVNDQKEINYVGNRKEFEALKEIEDLKDFDLLNNQITDLENIVKEMGLNKQINTVYENIKSLNNGQELCINENEYVDENGDKKKSFQVHMNNGCLSVGQNDYDVYKCDSNNLKQNFKMVHILNELMYSNNIDKLIPFTKPDTSQENYPFVLMKSVNTDNCLTNNHGEITVQPCAVLKAQQWIPLDNN